MGICVVRLTTNFKIKYDISLAYNIYTLLCVVKLNNMIKTIKDLKKIIQNLPDDMEVMGYKGGNGDLWRVSHWIISEETLTDEEKRDGYPNGVIPTLVISVD